MVSLMLFIFDFSLYSVLLCPHLPSVLICPPMLSSVLLCLPLPSYILLCPHLPSVLICPLSSVLICPPLSSFFFLCPQLFSSLVLFLPLPSSVLCCCPFSSFVLICPPLSSSVLCPTIVPFLPLPSSVLMLGLLVFCIPHSSLLCPASLSPVCPFPVWVGLLPGSFHRTNNTPVTHLWFIISPVLCLKRSVHASIVADSLFNSALNLECLYFICSSPSLSPDPARLAQPASTPC